MKTPTKYRHTDGEIVRAIRWADDVTVSDVVDFCDGLARRAGDGWQLYDIEEAVWWPLLPGYWIVADDRSHYPLSHDWFVRYYEEVSDAPAEPRGND